MVEQELERLLRAARADSDLKAELITTRYSYDPVEDFCALCDGWDDMYGQFFTELIWCK